MTEIQGKSILVRVSKGSSYRESTVVCNLFFMTVFFSQFMNIVVILRQWIDTHGIIYSFKSRSVPVTVHQLGLKCVTAS